MHEAAQFTALSLISLCLIHHPPTNTRAISKQVCYKNKSKIKAHLVMGVFEEKKLVLNFSYPCLLPPNWVPVPVPVPVFDLKYEH